MEEIAALINILKSSKNELGIFASLLLGSVAIIISRLFPVSKTDGATSQRLEELSRVTDVLSRKMLQMQRLHMIHHADDIKNMDLADV